jgi:hypothetical protein
VALCHLQNEQFRARFAVPAELAGRVREPRVAALRRSLDSHKAAISTQTGRSSREPLSRQVPLAP